LSSTEKNIVLIVDDEAANIITLMNILTPGYDVYAAKNGSDAIMLAKEHLPDVILLDVIMPDKDGFEVISELKNLEITKSIPVIFITGLENIEAEKKGLALGAADYISKPFNPDIVRLRVQNQIKIVNHIRALEERDEMERQLKKIQELEAGLIAAKEMAEHNRELAEHSSRAKSEFLSRMSHEMRTPMNAILGMLQIAKMRGIPDSLKKYLDEIDSSSSHLMRMIEDVLDVTGMEYGMFKLNDAAFDTSEMFKEVLDAAKYNASLKNQVLISRLDPSIPSSLIGDEGRLKQVVANLLANAVKFTPESGEISFSARVLDSENGIMTLLTEVTDSGIGITEDQQTRLFELFEQVDGSNTRKHSGIGIGLALSKRIALMMGGDISVESELGKGARFMFTCKLQTAGVQ